MNIQKFDLVLVAVSLISVILMAFVMPELGLAGDGVNESDVPQFDIQGDRFDFAGDFPSRPGGPEGGTMVWEEDLAGSSDNQRWLDGDTSGGTETLLRNWGNESDPVARLDLQDWSSGSVSDEQNTTLDTEGEWATLTVGSGYEVYYEVVEFRNVNQSDVEIHVSWQVQDQPSSDSWYHRIPIVGTAIQAGNDLAATVTWLGGVVKFFILTMFETVLNALGMLLDSVLYLFGTINWLVTTYLDVVTAPDLHGMVSVLLLVPGVLLMLELGKLVVVGVSVVWIG